MIATISTMPLIQLASGEREVAKGIRGIKNYLTQKVLLKLPGFPMPETTTHKAVFTPKSQIKTKQNMSYRRSDIKDFYPQPVATDRR